jgi:hypothetical protein
MKKTNENDDSGEMACTALRTVANNNIQLYTQADKKAHILIQVNALMVSVLLASGVQLSEFHNPAIIPLATQLVFSLAVILLSLRSTRPAGMPAPAAGEQRTVDLLHFGDYDQLEKDEYMTDMKDLLEDADRLYGGLTRNVYYQAQVLARKYRWLRRAFVVYIAGLGITVGMAIGIAIFG